MIIIAGHSRARNGVERDAAVAAFANMAERARTQDGCLDLSISSDSVVPERINVFECWRPAIPERLAQSRETPTGRFAGCPRETLPQRQSREAILRPAPQALFGPCDVDHTPKS
jgi:quinol monooxygenase YgiN